MLKITLNQYIEHVTWLKILTPTEEWFKWKYPEHAIVKS